MTPNRPDILENLRDDLFAKAEGWRNPPNDANAVQVALLEVAHALDAAIKAERPKIPFAKSRGIS